MKTNVIKWIFLTVSVVVFAVACKREQKIAEQEFKEPMLPSVAYDYSSEVPSFAITGASKIVMNNNVSQLGRVLFYEKFLSINNAVACASCHKQENAFADPNRVSVGFAAGLGTRNAPPIFNMFSNAALFWDGRANNLKDMVLMPISHNVEMGMESMEMLEAKLAKVPYYAALFQKAFGTTEVKRENIGMALAQFLLSIRSTSSEFDKNGQMALAPQAKRGMELFNKLHCQSCHGAADNPYYNSNMFNIGLEKTYTDKGRKDVTNSTLDEGKFKVPSLRNLAVTAPYMHDGRFKTLEEVIDHYNNGVVDHNMLASQLRSIHPGSGGWGNNNTQDPNRNKFGNPTLELNEQDKKDLIAFLNTLTDTRLLTDPRFSDPFNY